MPGSISTTGDVASGLVGPGPSKSRVIGAVPGVLSAATGTWGDGDGVGIVETPAPTATTAGDALLAVFRTSLEERAREIGLEEDIEARSSVNGWIAGVTPAPAPAPAPVKPTESKDVRAVDGTDGDNALSFPFKLEVPVPAVECDKEEECGYVSASGRTGAELLELPAAIAFEPGCRKSWVRDDCELEFCP